MSFLAGRLASTEGSYFLQESKQAVTRILQNQKNSAGVVKPIAENSEISSADVLPEVLRHSLPPQIFHAPSESLTSSFSGTSKWALKPDPKGGGGSGVSADALNPLRAYVSLPQVTFGPKRWQLPNSENSVLASTANDLRHDKYTPINPQKLKAAAAGLTQIGSAFAVATAVVFGATVIFGLAASKLEVHNTDDIRAKGKDLIQPKFETYREKISPFKNLGGRRVEEMAFRKGRIFEREASDKGAVQKTGCQDFHLSIFYFLL
ncbi:hypothetical protein Sango_2497300 [Sesamum angolense]|uniref:Uncharacterized protein n=1 Tax=Sesamum angolense TaxID=2727404 RepID=A0AAE2BI47_9LAMI|nr:hypothetical protein Sango_2497300 [Sesamum angolense]